MHPPFTAAFRSLSCAVLGALVTVATPAQEPSPADDGGGKAEWIDLFDGESLKGWQRINGTAEYSVVDGAIVGTTVKGSPNSFLCTDDFYGDFELIFDVKLLHDELNSGVQIRSHSIPEYKKGRLHGYQVEVSTNGNAGGIYDEARRGWLAKPRAPAEDGSIEDPFKRGEWNRYRVLCDGPRIRTWVNDKAVADLTDTWSATGRIGLQVHSVQGDPKMQVAWRNLRLRPIGDGGGWSPLFNGVDLDGWRVNENPDSVRVENGALVVGGPRAHAFYAGPVQHHTFRDFVFEAKVKAEAGANSGVYFHTEYQAGGWPAKGYEVQVNNSHGDWRRTGGLYGIEDLRESPAQDGEWFDLRITVRGRRVIVAVDGKECVDYTEPEDVERPQNFAGRLLGSGTFALQCHDPESVVHFKDLRVKLLP